jgi:Skp family chaperone for outer membrane proteins
MRRTCTLVLGGILIASALAMPAQAAENGVKVAVINLSQVFDQYRLTKDLETKFDEKRREMAAEAQKKQDEINVKRQALASFKPGTADYRTRRAALTEMQMTFEVWAGTREQLLRDSHKDWLLRIYNDVRGAVAETAKEQGIDLVLTYEEVTDEAPDSKTLRQQLMLEKVFYSSPRLDLTQTVIERVNKQYTGPDQIDLGISADATKEKPATTAVATTGATRR